MKINVILFSIGFFIFFSCDPFITEFGDLEDAVMYESSFFTEPEPDIISPKIVTWNIRFGAGRIPWTYDSCGDRVLLTDDELMDKLEELVDFINEIDPDIILLQEVDVLSKRSGYLDQVQWLLDNTKFNYGAYASMWQAQYIPNDGLGRIDQGNAILSKWKIGEAQRIQLSLRTDQSSFVQYFYLRRNILKTKIEVPSSITIDPFYAIVTHTTAFATDDTKQKHIDEFYDVLSSLEEGAVFVAGGDLNALSPWGWEQKRDFCEDDRCALDECDDDYENNLIYEGSYFNHLENERDLLLPLYNDFYSAIDASNTLDATINFTHSTWNIDEDNSNYSSSSDYWNRKLDYLFSSHSLINGNTHQEAHQLSDHAPVSAFMELE